MSEEKGKKGKRPFAVLLRFVLTLGLLALCLVGAFVGYALWLSGGAVGAGVTAVDNPNLSAPERLYLEMTLRANADALQQPAGTSAVAVPFTIEEGQSADQIAANLAEAGLLTDTQLFMSYVRYAGLDSQLEAGQFIIEPGLTIPELALTLTDAHAQQVTVRFVEGWRFDEMADYLARNPTANINAEEFRALAARQQPFDTTPFDFLSALPAQASLEGYLFPDTYIVPIDADATYLLTAMLNNFGSRVDPAMRQAFGVNGLTIHEAVTLASIVEREAVLAEERPLIAGVFYNRLVQGIKLQADPTVQYAAGYDAAAGTWWPSPLTQAQLDMPSPYNTYLNPGLPPGPIASPGLSALQAVAYPQPSDFVFFVANCAVGDGSHLFAVTYEEHVANVSACR